MSTEALTVPTSRSLFDTTTKTYTEEEAHPNLTSTSAAVSPLSTLIKFQSTITPTPVLYGTPDSGMRNYATRLPLPSPTFQTITDHISSMAHGTSKNARKTKLFYFVFILVIPIGMSFALWYKRRTQQRHDLNEKNQQYRENAGVYRKTTTSLPLDFIFSESTFSETQNNSLDSFDNISTSSKLSNENIYDSIPTLNSGSLLEQDGYLCPHGKQATRL